MNRIKSMNQNFVISVFIVIVLSFIFTMSGNFTGIKEITELIVFVQSKPLMEQIFFLIWVVIGLWSVFNTSEFYFFSGIFLRLELWIFIKGILFIVFFMLGIFLVPIQYLVAYIKRGV